MVNALPFIRQPDQNGKKASDVSAADWQYQIHVKNIVTLHVCSSTFLWAGNPCQI